MLVLTARTSPKPLFRRLVDSDNNYKPTGIRRRLARFFASRQDRVTEGIECPPHLPEGPALPREGDSVRSRLWSLILRELPFPFRQIGMEIAHVVRWLDRAAAHVWLGVHHSPGWYFVTVAGCLTLMLTGLLFFPYVASHDPTLSELAIDGRSAARATRASLEAAGEWSAQDRWRVAHLFVDHRPPRGRSAVRLDSRLIDEPTVRDSRSSRGHFTGDRIGAGQSRPRETADIPLNRSRQLDPEVRLDLATPGRATQTPRLVYDKLVRDPGAEFDPNPGSSYYRPRDKRLLVQAEWPFDPDCNKVDEAPRRPMTRRVIPVPEPQWDEPRPAQAPRVDRHPDLSFQMELLREYLPNVGEFPPQSRSTSVAAHSEFPHALDHARRSTPPAGHGDHWLRSTSHAEHRPLPEAYISRVHDHADGPETVGFSEADEEEDPNLASFAEVALRLELYAPHTVMAGKLHESSLLIHNEGPTPVSHVRVRESLAELQTVTDANPAARINHDELERDIRSLPPGRERRLGVTWLPDAEGSRVHRAAVTMHAAVGVTTNIVAPEPAAEPEPMPRVEPEPTPEPVIERLPIIERHPAIKCDVQHVDRVTVDEIVELEIVVRNTGDTALSDVRILVEVPAELKHRQGTEVEYEIGNLARRGSHKAVLRLLALAPGKAVNHIHVVTNESVESKARAPITIVAKPVARPTPRLPEVIRPVPAPAHKPAVKPHPIPTSSSCCCPGQPVAFLSEPWFIP